MTIIPKGTIFTITCGEYDDYTTLGVFCALDDIDTTVQRNQYVESKASVLKEELKNPRYESIFTEEEFIARLIQLELIEPVDWSEWHIKIDFTDMETELRR